MSEDIGNVEAELEALMAALEMAGVMADQARRRAVSLAKRMRKDAPRSRAEWDQRAQLVDGQGRDLGWMDTKDTRRIDLNDQTGAKDRGVGATWSARHRAGGDSALMEADGQFFAVQPGQRPGDPERVRPISLDEAERELEGRRPDLDVRRIEEGDPHLEVTRATSSTSKGGELADLMGERAGANPSAVWDAPGQEQAAEGGRPGRSAAEALGALTSRPGRTARSEGEEVAAPSTAELTAVGATKLAESTMKR